MRDHLKKTFALIVVAVLLLAGLMMILQSHDSDDVRQQIIETRRLLHAQGFKTELSEFNLTANTLAGSSLDTLLTFWGGNPMPQPIPERFNLLPELDGGSVVVIWSQDWFRDSGRNLTWTEVHSVLAPLDPDLDAACDAAISVSIEFNLDASRGSSMLLPHLSSLRRLDQMLGLRAMADLHEDKPNNAWTNLMALTRFATAWKVEPAEVSHMVRLALVSLDFSAIWQALQYEHWPEPRLAALQREWERADFFTNLPETIAFRRASEANDCEQLRTQPAPMMPLSGILGNAMHSPLAAIAYIRDMWNLARYRSQGVFADEKNLLLFYQQREIEMRQAIIAPTWEQMRVLPGVTNPPVFTSSFRSRFMPPRGPPGFARGSSPDTGMVGRAATAEASRRIIVTAIALERYRQKHGAYPRKLTDLSPEFLAQVPLDFMDGKPLRYQPRDNRQFQLYSVGLDCVDDGGNPPPPASRSGRSLVSGFFRTGAGGDIVWPAAATADEVATENAQATEAARAKADLVEAEQSMFQWDTTARRQAALDTILARPAITNLPEVLVHGRPLSQLLQNPEAVGASAVSLLEMLTLKQIITGNEPEDLMFELPIAFDAITNLCELGLLVDPTDPDESDLGLKAFDVDCIRATNGNCLLIWHTIYESPGRHAVQATATLNDLLPGKQIVAGPLLPVTVSNLCQFSVTSAHFDIGVGATFHARLPETDATYVIELNTTNGQRLQNISGSASNGEIKIFWDLKDIQGRRFAGQRFDSVFHLTLPASGRTQTLRGP